MPAEFFDPISDHKTPPSYRYFDGTQWLEGTTGTFTDVISPIDNAVVGKIPVVSPEEVDRIMEIGYQAQGAWGKTPLNERVKIVHLAADWIRHYEEYLTSLLVTEIGKSVSESKSEIKRTADLIDYYADEAQSIKGETLDSDNFPGYDKGRLALIEHVPYGVILAIAPFNYPVNLAASKIAPALLMGNSVIFKPPTSGAVSGIHLTRIFEKAGVPAGVITCVTGGGSAIGDQIVSHKRVDMIAFTGSSDTGEAIAKKAGMKPLLFECGGNNPAVVLPDADMKLTAKEIVKGGFAFSGQRCTAIKYVLASPGVIQTLIPVVLEAMKELVKAGDPRSPETKLIGPVISESVAQDIERVINEAVRDGAKIVTGGKRDKAFIEATILENVNPSMEVVRREIFGPVVSFIPMENLSDMAKMIKESHYGLQASIFTSDEGAGLAFAADLKVGTVQINGSPQRGPDHYPFLGIKGSGVGVQGVRYSLEAMSRLRPIVINKPK